MSALDPIPYTDAKLRRILSTVRTIAMVGASSNWNRPSYFVMKYLQGKGYRVIPVNPGTAGQQQLGEKIYASLRDIPEKIDMVDMFRASDQVGPIVDDAIAIGAKVVWMQLGVRNDAAAEKAEAAGIEVVMNRCPKIEFGRLGGELSWSGVNSGIIRNRAAQPPTDRRAEAAADAGGERHAMVSRRARSTPAPRPDPTTGARSTPIFQTTAYVFDDVDHAASLFNLHNFGYIYSRLNNPTVSVLEERIASLEGGRAAVAAASGHAAQFLVFATMLEPGDEFLASRALYGGSLTQFGLSFKKLGWHCHFVDPLDPENFRRALTPKCKAIFVESLANPGGVVVDLAAIAEIAHSVGIPLIVDNTLATPYSVPAVRVGRRSGHPLHHEVPWRARQFDGRHGGGVRQIRLGGEREIPVADRAGTGLSRPAVLREFRRLRVYHEGARGGVARLRPDDGADERVPDHHRHRNIACPHGTALRERAKSRGISGGARQGRVGVLRRARNEPVSCAGAEIHAEGRRLGVHVRRQGRLRCRRETGGERRDCSRIWRISATRAV